MLDVSAVVEDDRDRNRSFGGSVRSQGDADGQGDARGGAAVERQDQGRTQRLRCLYTAHDHLQVPGQQARDAIAATAGVGQNDVGVDEWHQASSNWGR